MHLTIDGSSRTISPGHVVMVTPSHRVHISFAKHEETWHRWVSIVAENDATDIIANVAHVPAVLPISEQMNRLVDVLIGLQQQKPEENSVVRHSLALGAIQLFLTESEQSITCAKHPSISLVKAFIHERFDTDITLSGLASEAHVTPGHLIRLFRQHEETTPMQYVWRYRVERGLELLRRTGLSIKEISRRCGFKTSYHFARMVKSHTGRTPTEIRSHSWGIHTHE